MTGDGSLEEYTRLFASLRVNTSRIACPDTYNRSPNKPLLLLTVLDLFSRGAVTEGRVLAVPELGEIFSDYWYRVMPADYRPNLALPFFHLHRDGGFWQLVSTPGNEHTLQHIERAGQIRTVSMLHDPVACAQLDPGLVRHISLPPEREILREVLIQNYFAPSAHSRLRHQSKVNSQSYEYSLELLRPSLVAEASATYSDDYRVRDRGFRRAIMVAYDYRCCMCGIRVVTLDGHAAVDAAHISAWSTSHNDHPTNGLALCRLCHWAFDEGLLGADRGRTIMVSPQLSVTTNVPGHLAQLADRPLFPPADVTWSPDVNALSWHRSHIFRLH